MTAHTKGPWIVFETPNDPDFTHEISNVCCIYAGNGHSHPNARLIAAAPDLLEALESIAALENTEENEWDAVEVVIPEMCKIARATIAKARGEA
jgi:hypothetical protein